MLNNNVFFDDFQTPADKKLKNLWFLIDVFSKCSKNIGVMTIFRWTTGGILGDELVGIWEKMTRWILGAELGGIWEATTRR